MAGIGNPQGSLPRRFRKLSVEDRRAIVESATTDSTGDFALTGESKELLDMADVLVESAVGYMAIPVGIAESFLIDGKIYDIPLATEEPSVVAAASYAAKIIADGGGFSTTPATPIMGGMVYLLPAETPADALIELLLDSRERLRGVLESSLNRISERGGGLRSVDIAPTGRFVRLSFDIDVRDAMGANIVNTAAELLAREVSLMSDAEVIISILSNSSNRRIGKAQFSIASDKIPGTDRMSGKEVARRICLASEIAESDPDRAITHNKGVMNGVTALALATGNDTRGIEAAVHAWASRGGEYTPLSRYRIEAEHLIGEIELPLPFATTGGAVSFHPSARAFLQILGAVNARDLTRIAAAVGLAQNFAALRALVTSGIQSGHMPLHARRLAYEAGARGPEIRDVARQMIDSGTCNMNAAKRIVDSLNR